MHHNNDFDRPRGGHPSRLTTSQIECMYCSKAIARATKHRTCPACAAEWAKEFGPKWFKQSWHADLVAEHIAVFGGNDREAAVSSDKVGELADTADKAVALPQRGKRVAKGGAQIDEANHVVFEAIKDILLVVRAAQDPAVLRNIAGRVRPHELMLIPCGPLGADRMTKMLTDRGFRERPAPDQDGKMPPPSPMWLPAERTIEKYIKLAKAELDAPGGYRTERRYCEADELEAAAQELVAGKVVLFKAQDTENPPVATADLGA